jgi:ribosome biogenesis GTPase
VADPVRGTIVKALSGFYYVRPTAEQSVYKCRARGIFKKEGISPLVGDEAEIDVLDDEDGLVTEILPRRNSFIRPAVANIDLFVATVSTRDPEPHPEVLDRFLVTAEAADAAAIICVNKTDLRPVGFIDEIYGALYDTVAVSAATGEGMDALRQKLIGRRSAFAGPSGVGKSSIINFLLGRNASDTGGVSGKTGRGKHTTRHVEIFETDFGAQLLDTPGYTSFEGTITEPGTLGMLFPEIAKLSEQCRFDDCMHADEPDCAVCEACATGAIAPSRYSTYRRMLEESLERKKKGK